MPKQYAARHIPIIRHYSDNVYDIDRKEVEQIWDSRTYPKSGDCSEEMAYDHALDCNEMLTLNIQSYTGRLPVDRLTFSRNRIAYPNVGGMISSSQWLCDQFVCENNVFSCRNVSSDEYSSRSKSRKFKDYSEWLFAIRGRSSLIRIRHNTFTARNEHVRLLLYKFNEGEPARAAKTIVEKNTLEKSSGFHIRSLNTTKWKWCEYR